MLYNRAQSDHLLIQFQNACVELRRRLLSGQACRVEEVLNEFPLLANDEALAVRLVHAEWSIRHELGESPSPAVWLERFPQYREPLESRFRDDNLLADSVLENLPTVQLRSPQAGGLEATQAALDASWQGMPEQAPATALEIFEVIGKGAMGVVYRAHDKMLDRDVALKKMNAKLLAYPEAVQRFFEEARAVAQLNHPNIIAIYSMGRIGDHYGIVMPLATCSLDKELSRFAEPKDAANLLAKIARAMDAAHRRRRIHRDLKPANILLDERYEPLVADFGLAVLLRELRTAAEVREVAGTPHYMAPEQLDEAQLEVSLKTDIWALGVILYELLAQNRPFAANTIEQLQVEINRAEPAAIKSKTKSIDRGLDAIVRRCLKRNPNERYETAAQLAQDLENWQAGLPIVALPEGWYQRGWREARRQPGAAAALTTTALLLLVMSVGLAALYAATPNLTPAVSSEAADVQLLHAINARLLNHETVEFVTPEGGLLRHKWIREDGGVSPNEKNMTLQGVDVQTRRFFALLELLPEMPIEHFRLSADFYVWPAKETAHAGIYFMHTVHPKNALLAHSYYALTVTEGGPLDKFNEKPNGYCRGSFNYNAAYPSIGQDACVPYDLKFYQRHSFEVEVSPAQAVLSFDGKVCRTVYPKTIQEETDRMVLGNVLAHQIKNIPLVPLEPNFDLRGGVGVYVLNDTITFHSLRIQPLP